MTVQFDPNITPMDYDVLRVLNGEAVDGLVSGAGIWTTAAWLRRHGYASWTYQITDKGLTYLKAYPRPEN